MQLEKRLFCVVFILSGLFVQSFGPDARKLRWTLLSLYLLMVTCVVIMYFFVFGGILFCNGSGSVIVHFVYRLTDLYFLRLFKVKSIFHLKEWS